MADPIFVENFEANPAREGPQVILSWTFPVGFSGFISDITLRRKQGSFPASIIDGKEVFTSSALTETEFSDTDVERGICFYYTMFSKQISDSADVFDSTTQDEVVPYATSFFERALFEKLPNIYKTSDGNAAIVDQLILAQETVSSTNSGVRAGQIVNFNEPIVPKGFLRRYLKVLGLELDKLKETTEFYTDFWDLDETCASLLSFLGGIIGVVPNFDLSVDRQRDEVRRAVSQYKIKGTEPMLVSLISGITGGVVPVLAFWRENVLITNDVNSTSYSFDPADVLAQFTATDPADYIVSNDPLGYNFNKIAIFFDVTGIGISKTVVDKLRRILPDFLPARIEVIFTFIDSATETVLMDVTESTVESVTVGDSYDAGNVVETTDETIETLFLIANDGLRGVNTEFVTPTVVP